MPSLLSPERRQMAHHTVRAAWRTGLYSLGTALLRNRPSQPTKAQRRLSWRLIGEAFALQREGFRNPELAAALKRLEREDLLDLSTFALSLPFDLYRARAKRRGVAAPAVRPPDSFAYPDYYLHDFHNQHNGGLSDRAAITYEWQIRFLFCGTNRLMRQAVIDQIPRGAGLSILDVGCGTAAWLPQARLQGRLHEVVGVDLSPSYLRVARDRHDPRATFLQDNCETMAQVADSSFDMVVCIWLYHELPDAARQRITERLTRALRPGGTLLLMEAIQQGDLPDADINEMNAAFARDFDEPYFTSYQAMDLVKHLESAGLRLQEQRRVFVSKLLTLRRPSGDAGAPT